MHLSCLMTDVHKDMIMNKTTEPKTDTPITVDIDGLAAMLSCGHTTARKIGVQAKAKVVIGKRVLYSVDRIKQYIDDITG